MYVFIALKCGSAARLLCARPTCLMRSLPLCTSRDGAWPSPPNRAPRNSRFTATGAAARNDGKDAALSMRAPFVRPSMERIAEPIGPRTRTRHTFSPRCTTQRAPISARSCSIATLSSKHPAVSSHSVSLTRPSDISAPTMRANASVLARSAGVAIAKRNSPTWSANAASSAPTTSSGESTATATRCAAVRSSAHTHSPVARRILWSGVHVIVRPSSSVTVTQARTPLLAPALQ
jgi:hypothetical protein